MKVTAVAISLMGWIHNGKPPVRREQPSCREHNLGAPVHPGTGQLLHPIQVVPSVRQGPVRALARSCQLTHAVYPAAIPFR